MDTNTGSECLKKGTILNQKYEIRSVIGTGGFAYTYLCHDMILDMPVAVKQYRGGSSHSEQGNKWFLNEARIMAKFAGNPGIVCVRDFFEENKRAFIVMEYLEGDNLNEYLKKKGKLSWEQTFAYMKPVMKVLDSIHKAGVIHRDISPDNIMMMEKSNTVKLLDFGAAKDTGKKSEDQPVMYKRGYTPEEQFQSLELQGPWTDVYAICATMYKCITGRTPDSSLQRVYEDTVFKPSQMGLEIPEAFEKVLMRGMAVHREDRIQSMKELLMAMESSLAEQEEDGCTMLAEEESFLPAENPVVVQETDAGKDKVVSKNPAAGRHRYGLLIPLILAILGVSGLGMAYYIEEQENPYEYDMTTSKVEGKTVTPELLKKIRRSKASEKLYFTSCVLDDEAVEALGEMERLHSLFLEDCTGYTSLEPLEQLPGLTKLEITGEEGEFKEWTGEFFKGAELNNLTELKLNHMNFTEGTEFLKKFTELTSLDLSENMGMESTGFLQTMEDLEVLKLTNSQIKDHDWSFLEYCPYLVELQGDHTGFTPPSEPLKNTKLEKVSLRGNELSSIKFLSGCTKISDLDLGENKIKSLDPLGAYENLYRLNLEENQISGVHHLRHHLEDLEELDLSGNQIGSLTFLSECRNLTKLDVSDNRLKFLEGLEGKPELTSLWASGNMLRNLEAIRDSVHLTNLDFENNQLQNIRALSGLEGDVEVLLLANNQIKDISMLPSGISYGILTLEGNPIRDYVFFRKMEEKGSLVGQATVSYTEEADLVPVLEKTYEKNLYLVDAPESFQEEFQASKQIHFITKEEAEESKAV